MTFPSPKRLSLPVVLILAIAPTLNCGQDADNPASTFLLFKYQHPVGTETDKCDRSAVGIHCTAHFELRFTGESVPLDADLETDNLLHPLAYRVKGRNSTRSDLDVSVTISGGQAKIVDDGHTRTINVPQNAFTLVENVPLLTQELLLGYWKKNGHPREIPLLPEGKVRIQLRGTDHVRIAGHDESLERYTLHGVTWGDETLWLNGGQQVAAIIGTDAEEDRFEAFRPQYTPAMKQLVTQAAADAVASLESVARKLNPLASGTVAFTHATVIDPRGSPPLHDATVVISDGKILAVGNNARIPATAVVLNAQGKFILPGLWDTHAHFEQWEWALAYLASGTTSVRDVGNEIEFLTAIRRSINTGRSLGPQIYAAGLIDSDPGSLTSEHAESPETARSIVSRYHDLGYEEIKIYQSLRPELVPVVTAQAHLLNMKVTGHIPTGMDAFQGVTGGMDMINHIGFVTRVMHSQGSRDVRADSPEAQKAVHFFLDHHTIIEPTLARGEFNLHPRQRNFGEIEPSVSLLPPELAVILTHAGLPPEDEARAQSSLQIALQVTRILHQAGVTLLAGTDQVVPGHSIYRELELLVEAGLTPIEAIRCATLTPAEVLGVSAEVGAVEVGKRADLVILDADPTQDIHNVRRVHWTISRGRVFASQGLWSAVDFRSPFNSNQQN